MIRSTSKLPRWQTSGSSPYIRRGVLKRFRTIIFLLLFIFFWRRYSSSFRSGYSEEDENVITDPSTIEDLRPHPLLKIRNTVTEIAPIYLTPERKREKRQELENAAQISFREGPVGLSSVSGEEKHEAPKPQEPVIANSKSGGSLATLENHPQVLVVKSPESEELKEEPEDDEAPEKAALLSKAKARVNTESSLDTDQRPLEVLEASQKVIEQPSSLAVKEDTDSPAKTPSDPEGNPRFPDYSHYLELTEKAEAVPDIVHITFAEATENITLVGWEDAWFSDVEFDVQKWGNLSESKIDFVYTCKS